MIKSIKYLQSHKIYTNIVYYNIIHIRRKEQVMFDDGV